MLPLCPWGGKKISITYSECVFVALRIQHAISMRQIVICSLPGSTVFSTVSHKRHYFRKKKLLNIKYVFLFAPQLLSETLFILRRTE